jgi:hypothetical protein
MHFTSLTERGLRMLRQAGFGIVIKLWAHKRRSISSTAGGSVPFDELSGRHPLSARQFIEWHRPSTCKKSPALTTFKPKWLFAKKNERLRSVWVYFYRGVADDSVLLGCDITSRVIGSRLFDRRQCLRSDHPATWLYILQKRNSIKSFITNVILPKYQFKNCVQQLVNVWRLMANKAASEFENLFDL